MQHKEAVLRLSPWSMSKAQTALNCPFKFYKSYIEKRKGVQPRKRSGELGAVVHKILEMVLRNEASIKDAFQRVLTSTPLTTEEQEEVMSYAHNIQSFMDRIKKFCSEQNIQQTFVEHKFGLTIDNQKTAFYSKDVFFRGVWDFAALTQTNHLIIIDHKTGETKDIGFYRDQLNLYAVSALAVVPDLAGVQGAIHYVGVEEIVWDNPIKRTTIESTLLPWYVEFLEKAATASVSGAPQKSWLCNFCEHIDICPLQS